MGDPQGVHCVFHYSDIRISGFGFFRIFALYCHNFDPLVLNFGMWRPEHLALNFNYPDFRISGFGCSDFFRIFDNFFGFRIFFIFSLSLTVSEANYVDIDDHCSQRAKRATYISSSVLAPSPRPKGEQGRRRRSRVCSYFTNRREIWIRLHFTNILDFRIYPHLFKIVTNNYQRLVTISNDFFHD